MVSLVGIAVISVVALFFGSQLLVSAKGFLKSPQEKDAEKAIEKARAEKGAIGNTIDFLFGEGKSSGNMKSLTQLKQEAIDNAEKKIERDAKKQGFKTVEEFNKATDSGSIVIGGERTVIDFGAIGKPRPNAVMTTVISSPTGITGRFTSSRFRRGR